jgi:Sulfotransferase domain
VQLWKSLVRLSGRTSLGRSGSQYSTPMNVYHCCVPKTGSQWIRKILSDPLASQYSGLNTYHYQSKLPGKRDSRPIKDRVFAEPFPIGSVISPLYISFESFTFLPKPQVYRAFFVQRDPRDILVSWYFSMKHSHPILGNIPQLRQTLNAARFEDGILYAMEHLHRSGHFEALASWIDAPKSDPNAAVFRFEDLIGPTSLDVFSALFKHCNIFIPRDVLKGILTKYSFQALSGREQGDERPEAHYRKGISGDWKNYLDEALLKRFEDLTGNLIARLG